MYLGILYIYMQLQSLYCQWKHYQEKPSGFQCYIETISKYGLLPNRLVLFILLLWSEICGKINNCQIALFTEEQEKAFPPRS